MYMNLYVCIMYVCRQTCIDAYSCKCVCMYLSICLCSIHVFMMTYAGNYVCMQTSIHMYIHTSVTYMHTSVPGVCIYICKQMYEYVCGCMYICM